MTQDEREELERMREHLASAIKNDYNETTKDFWWQPSCVALLVELERKDAAEKDREGVMECIRGASERLRASGSAIEACVAQMFDTANRQIRNL